MVKDLTDLVSGKVHFQAQSWYLIMSPYGKGGEQVPLGLFCKDIGSFIWEEPS